MVHGPGPGGGPWTGGQCYVYTRLGPPPVADDDDTDSQEENERKIRPIIVKFLSYRVRNKVIKARRNLKGRKISITEALVKGRRDLLRKAQERVGFRNAWSYNGKIFAKRNNVIVRINGIHDLSIKL